MYWVIKFALYVCKVLLIFENFKIILYKFKISGVVLGVSKNICVLILSLATNHLLKKKQKKHKYPS